jgi:predicted acylesterase/phospholipase RssA
MKDMITFILGAAFGAIFASFIAPQRGRARPATIQAADDDDWQNFQKQWQVGMQKMYATLSQMQSEPKSASIGCCKERSS